MSIAVGLPPNKVKRDISTMIRERCIDGEELEAARRMLLAHHRGQSGADGAKEVSVAGALCPACGARNTVRRGQVAECEYCGAPIEGK